MKRPSGSRANRPQGLHIALRIAFLAFEARELRLSRDLGANRDKLAQRRILDSGSTLDQVTLLLERWSGGEEQAFEKVTELLYHELRAIAGNYLRRERADHTLQPTALIHEAYLRLVRIDRLTFANRQHFLSLAARMMRQILVDHARQVKTAKRGGGAMKIEVNETLAVSPDRADEFLALDEALSKLAIFSERQAQIIELRYFAGLGVEEVGETLGISPATVSRGQRMAEAWLGQTMTASRNPVLGAS